MSVSQEPRSIIHECVILEVSWTGHSPPIRSPFVGPRLKPMSLRGPHVGRDVIILRDFPTTVTVSVTRLSFVSSTFTYLVDGTFFKSVPFFLTVFDSGVTANICYRR